MDLALIVKAVRALRSGRVGDAAAYKAAAFASAAHPDVERRLRRLACPFPTIDLRELDALPIGTFGHAYVAFMHVRRLTPIVVSPEVADELVASHLLAVRYPIVHDAFHVLLGFGTDLPGELGVWTFVAEQGSCRSFERAAALARSLYPVVAPHRRAQLARARVRGLALARSAACLIAEPLETFWQDPLADVRRALRIPLHDGG